MLNDLLKMKTNGIKILYDFYNGLCYLIIKRFIK